MFGPTDFPRGGRFVWCLLLVVGAEFRADASGVPDSWGSAAATAGSLQLPAAGQEFDDDDRPRGRRRGPTSDAPSTPEEARARIEARKKALLESLEKKFPELKKSQKPEAQPNDKKDKKEDKKADKPKAEPEKDKGGTPQGKRADDPAPRSPAVSQGTSKSLVRNADETSWTIARFPNQSGKGYRAASEYPPDDYVLRHATEIYGMTSADSSGTFSFDLAIPLPLDIGEYRRLETIASIKTENLEIIESELRTIKQAENTFLYFKVKAEGKQPGKKNVYFIRASWMMVPAVFAPPGKSVESEMHPWAVELQAEAARRARAEIDAVTSAGGSPLEEKFQQCGRCAIDLRNVSKKKLLVVSGHHFSDEATGPRTWIEGLHAWNMSTKGNIIVDGTGGNYVGPQGCNFFPTRIYPDCTTINDPFTLDVGGGTVLTMAMNTASLCRYSRNFEKARNSQKVYFDSAEGWGANVHEQVRLATIKRVTKLFQQEVAIRQRVNGR